MFRMDTAKIDIDMRLDRAGERGVVTGRGSARLEYGAFPILERARAPLGRYGLSPPPEQANGPATVDVMLSGAGWSFTRARGTVPGCEAIGDVRVGFDASLDGALVVTLGEELLARSAVLVVPSMLAGRLTVPVRIGGTLGAPRVDADLAACLGRFVSDNRVTALFSEAASDVMTILTGREAPRPPPPSSPLHPPVATPPARDPRTEDELMRELVCIGRGLGRDRRAPRRAPPWRRSSSHRLTLGPEF